MKELRAYIINIKDIEDETQRIKVTQTNITDDEFMDIAEEQGNVYSLKGLENLGRGSTDVYSLESFENLINIGEHIDFEKQKLRFINVEIPDLVCPSCGYQGDYCDFPDLYVDGDGEQADLLREMQTKGFNIVTCGNCGQPFIHRTNLT